MESSAPNLLMVEGSFYDQVDELAQYIDTLKHTPDALSGELASLLEKEDKDEVVRKLVGASSALSQAPEKGMLSLELQYANDVFTLPRYINV